MNSLSSLLLILCFASCKIKEEQKPQKIAHIQLPDTSWLKHIVPLRKDIGVMRIYLPKTYDAYQAVDTLLTSDALDKCYFNDIYQFRPHRFAPLGLKYCFWGGLVPDSTQLITISHRTFSSCDTRFANKLSLVTYYRISMYNKELKLNNARSEYLHDDSMIISGHPYYLMKQSDTLNTANRPYYYNLTAHILISAEKYKSVS